MRQTSYNYVIFVICLLTKEIYKNNILIDLIINCLILILCYKLNKSSFIDN